MSNHWSQKIERRFALKLPEDVRAWMDQQPWHPGGGAEFSVALSPEQLLEPDPGTIWAGFMLPDTLPLIGNGYGDWLCLRVGADGGVTEVVRWAHGGGDWLPYGGRLAESLLYDLVAHVAPIRSPVFASPERAPARVRSLGQWAADRLALDVAFLFADPAPADGNAALDLLLQHGVAEFAVRRDRALHWLESALKSVSAPDVARTLDVAWEPDFVRWLFDTRLIPEQQRDRLARHFATEPNQLFRQAWDRAEREALTVIAKRHDLGWAFDVAGWAAERRGDPEQAVQRYLAGLKTSLFSDETVPFRTHWFNERFGKFAAARLDALKVHLSKQQLHDPYLNLFWQQDAESLRVRVRDYWLGKARQASDPMVAYRHYYRAGWDLGANEIGTYDEVFAGLVKSALEANADALAAVAKLHRRFLG